MLTRNRSSVRLAIWGGALLLLSCCCHHCDASLMPSSYPGDDVTGWNCSDTRYCESTTCEPVLNASGGTDLSGGCVGLGPYWASYHCATGTFGCITVVHYQDSECTTVSREDAAVCGQCVSHREGWMFLNCSADGTSVAASSCSNANCSTCTPLTTLPTGVCYNVGALTGGIVVERGAFTCSAILMSAYNTSQCAGAPIGQSYVPGGYCRHGSIVSCASMNPTSPPSTTPPTTPVPMTPPPTPSFSLLSASTCLDPHCTFNCTSRGFFPSGACLGSNDLFSFGSSGGNYSVSYSCRGLQQGASWVVGLFSNASCVALEGQLQLACGVCQKSFHLSGFFSISCDPVAPQLSTGCVDSTCSTCSSSMPLQVGMCAVDAGGRYIVAQRLLPAGPLIQMSVYQGASCAALPVSNYIMASGGCEGSSVLRCITVPNTVSPTQTVTSFTATFNAAPSAAAMSLALTSAFAYPVGVQFDDNGITLVRCGSATCYSVSFVLSGPNASLAGSELLGLSDAVPAAMIAWFNITSLAASGQVPPSEKNISSSIIVVIAVSAAIGLLLLVGAVLFAQRHSKLLHTDDVLDGDEYVAMSEASPNQRPR